MVWSHKRLNLHVSKAREVFKYRHFPIWKGWLLEVWTSAQKSGQNQGRRRWAEWNWGGARDPSNSRWDEAGNWFYFAVLRGTQSLSKGGSLVLSHTPASQSIHSSAGFHQLKANHLTAGINRAVDFKVPHSASPKSPVKACIGPFCPSCVEHFDVWWK